MMNNILGLPIKSLREVTEESIVVAKDLTPSDTAQIDKTLIKAFCTDIGGRTSHTAIMARLQEIPAVVGLSDITSRVKDGDMIIVDGNKGEIHINPAPDLLKEYQKLKEEYEQYKHGLKSLKGLPAETAEKARRVELAANIGSLKDCENAIENGAEGIGLFRTEFLYMDRGTLPDEQEQFEIYKAVASRMSPHPVIIRTLDIGGDKKTPCLELPDEMNPFLGWRAIRICLDRPDIFKTQLRAILRASCHGHIRIMYPMISNIAELRSANSVLHEAMDELDHERLEYNKKIEVGIMVEIPSAAITADILIKEADFFSIGTNDLIQYTVAVDRMNERISHLYEPFNPAVLRLIKNVIDASHKAGKWTGMCGELAGDAAAVPILLGMGLDEFSMNAASILTVKKVIRSLTMRQAQEIADKALSLETSEMIKEMLLMPLKLQ